jgi:Response regulator containing CheY-like receiver and SARP domains
MFRAIAVDDEDIALERLGKLIGEDENLMLVGSYLDPEEALKRASDDTADVAFVDIEMPYMDGLELAENLMNKNPALEVIFVTAYDKYALQAFQAHAIGYLLKPVEALDIKEQVENLMRRLNRNKADILNNKLYIRCFGCFECSFGENGVESLGFRTAKALELVAFLNHRRGGSASRDEIIEALWPDMDVERAAKNFHATTHYVRKALAEKGLSDILICMRGRYALKNDRLISDLEQFSVISGESNIKNLSLQHLETASGVYRGSYLGDQDYPWARENQLKYETEFEFLQILIADAYSKEKRFLEAVRSLRKILEYIPLSEEGNKKLIRLYIEAGDKNKAITIYKSYEALLEKELGVEVSEEIKNMLV